MDWKDPLAGLLTDIDAFLLAVLKKASLPRSLQNERIQLLSKIKEFVETHLPASDGYGYILANRETETRPSTLTRGLSGSLPSICQPEFDPKAAQDLEPAVKSGHLQKLRKPGIQSILGPEKRWCVIKDDKFYYYNNANSKSQRGAFTLEGYQANAPATADEKKDNVFSVTCPGKRTYKFMASSSEEMDKWMEVINADTVIKEDTESLNLSNSESFDLPGEIYENTDIENGPISPAIGIPAANKALVGSGVEEGEIYDDTQVDDGPIQPRNVPPCSVANQVATGQTCPLAEEVYEETAVPNQPIQPQRNIMPVATVGTVTCDDDELYTDTTIENGPIAGRRAVPSIAQTGNEQDGHVQGNPAYVKSKTFVDAPVVQPILRDKSVKRNTANSLVEDEIYAEPDTLDGYRSGSYIDDDDIYEEYSNDEGIRGKWARTSSKTSSLNRDTLLPPPLKKNDEDIYENIDYSQLHYALYDFKPEREKELKFAKGDLMLVLAKTFDPWWTARAKDLIGFVPKNYLAPVYSKEQ